MTFVLVVIAISLFTTLLAVVVISTILGRVKATSERLNPGAKVPVSMSSAGLSTEQQVRILIDAATAKAETPYYALAEHQRCLGLAHKLSHIEIELSKVKVQIYTFSFCIGAFSLCLGVWAAIETVK